MSSIAQLKRRVEAVTAAKRDRPAGSPFGRHGWIVGKNGRLSMRYMAPDEPYICDLKWILETYGPVSDRPGPDEIDQMSYAELDRHVHTLLTATPPRPGDHPRIRRARGFFERLDSDPDEAWDHAGSVGARKIDYSQIVCQERGETIRPFIELTPRPVISPRTSKK